LRSFLQHYGSGKTKKTRAYEQKKALTADSKNWLKDEDISISVEFYTA
jgi:hypothetical protein